MANNKSNFDATQTAQSWRELGVYTVPLQSRSKRPKHTNWTKLRLDGEQLDRAFSVGDNIGALWGDPSEGITDLDLDLPEACDVAQHILPETFVYGRREKPWSHYLFRCSGATTKKWQIRKIGTVVEIRSTGAQSVLPPSIHPDGDRYQIEHDIDFADVTKRELESYADEIAIAAVYVRFYPDAGSRHDYVHACTGALCHADWSDEKIRRVMAAVLSVIQDDEDELQDRKGSVLNTIEHYELGDRVQGLRTLEQWLDTHTIQQLRRWCTSGKTAGRVLKSAGGAVKLQADPKPLETDFNSEWLEIGGLVSEVAEWASKSSYVQQPMFNLATGLMCTALASCNNYVVDGWDTPLQPYLMVTAPTGDGKNAVLRAVQKFADQLDLGEYVHQEFQSYYAMLDRLAEPPSIACLIWDEAARHLASSRNPMTTSYQMISHVISLYGRAAEWVPGSPGRKQEIPALEHPFLIVLATAQPDQLMQALGNTAQETGFANRFLLFDSGDDYPPRNRRRSKTFPSSIKKHAKLLRDHEPTNDFTDITWADAKTYNLFDEFEETARRRTHKGEKAWARANQNALILAGLAAIGIDATKPVITEEIARWALQLATWSTDRWADKIRLVGGDTITEKESFRVEERIRNARKYEGSTQSLVHKDLVRKGFMPHSLLLKVTRSIQRHRLEQILDDLHDADLIDSTEMKDNKVYFPK